MEVIKKEGGRMYLGGSGIYREYVIAPKIVLGSSILHPGQTRRIDPRHPENHEVSYVSRGEVLIYNTQIDEFYELHKDNIILVYEGEPHEPTNIGTDMAAITWSCASKTD